MNKGLHAWYAVFLFVPVTAFTQQPPTPESLAPSTPALAARPANPAAPAAVEGRIHLDVVVTDRPGKPISGLALEDFTLEDNNLPVKILSFHAIEPASQLASHPVEVILLIDAVNEGFQTAARARVDILKFLRENGGHLGQPVSVFVLNSDGVKVLVQPSMDGNALAAQLDQSDSELRVIGRSGGMNGAFERYQLSIRAMTMIASNEVKRPGRKLLIWAGSGWPLLERPGAEISSQGQQEIFHEIVHLSTTMREAHMTVSSVSLGDPHLGTYLYEGYLKGVKTAERVNPANLSLKVLAIQSGGRALPPDYDLAGQIEICVQDAGPFYTISFDPPRADKPNEYHDLRVEIDKPGLTARTDTGFYNQP
ncbi:MAG: VWA domain-containing protein [Terracidiphilus sp.]|jgi:VWFA-related protein